MPSFGLFRREKNQDDKEVIVVSTSKDEVDVAVEQVVGNVNELKVEQSSVAGEKALVAVAVEGDGVLAEDESVSSDSSVVEEGVVEGGSDGVVEQMESGVVDGKLYLKAVPLRDTLDLEGIKAEVEGGNILILRITPLASKSIEAVKCAVNELYVFVESIGGDIARLGEERVVVCPKNVRIWREKASFKKSDVS
ncbi:MAG: cell division protein SepF [Candidatus Bathyarchaeota archaeon]|nr:cell division protein SepF [Candidatus Termiticorpusculum sp.]